MITSLPKDRLTVLKRNILDKGRAGSDKNKVRSARLKGQALVVVALMMTVLILFLGLGVDAGNLMGKSAKLQSAVDAAALSAAETLSGGNAITQTATTKAYQMLEANGIPSNTLTVRDVTVESNQVHIKASQSVNTYFMRIIPIWRTVQVKAEAIADLNSYAEITTKPYGLPGVVNELNMMVWGADSWRRGGDAYSAITGTGANGLTANPEHNKQPYGYLFRIDVPPSYSSNRIVVQFFDPDTYNRTGAPPAWPSCSPAPCTTPTPTADQYAYCPSFRPDCTSGGANYDTGMKLNAFSNGRPAFWRVDEIRNPYTIPFGGPTPSPSYATTTEFTLWHFNSHITSAFGDPATLSDQPMAGGYNYLAQYTVGSDARTDLSWYQPTGFDIQLKDNLGNDLFEREGNGGYYFYLYIRGAAGSSENNYDIRVGPPNLNTTQACTTLPTPCYVNQLYLDNLRNPSGNPDWNDGGGRIFAKRALPLNLVSGSSFPLAFTQISKNAAGQTLGVRHFDQDCNNGCGSVMQYQMQICRPGGCDLNDPSCWSNIGIGYVGQDNNWVAPPDASHPPPGGYPDPEPVTIPVEGSANYTLFFGDSGQCPTSWLRIQRNPSYPGDSTVWEMPYIRPRLVK